MEKQFSTFTLQDIDPQAASLLKRLQPDGSSEGQSEELAFFSEVVTIFSREAELPIEQLSAFPATVILRYLTNSHRYYLGKRVPEIEQLLSQLSAQNLNVPAHLVSFFSWMRQNMEKHFRIEEQSLFPYIEAFERLSKGENAADIRSKFKEFSIQRFTDTHSDEIEDQLSEVKKQIIRSFVSLEALFPYRVLIQKLDLFEKDLRLHARVEDEVLVPKALEWEKLLR